MVGTRGREFAHGTFETTPQFGITGVQLSSGLRQQKLGNTDWQFVGRQGL